MTHSDAIVRRLRIFLFLFVAAIALSTPTVFGDMYSPPSNPREDINLDAGWRFIRQDVAGAQTNGFNDSTWTLLNLPHTWNNLDGQDGGGNYYRGIGWYRLHYTVSTNEAGRRLFLKFDGANIVSDVYVNGNLVGEHQGGFAAFVYDVTSYMNAGADNVIAVKVNNAFNASIPPLDADFTFFGGIYRDVHLLATDPVQVSPLDYGSPGVYLKTTSVSSNSANLQVTTVVSNASANSATVTVRAIVTDAATNIVATLTNIVTLSASSVSNVVGSAIISNPHLWNGLNDPYLYQTFVEVYNGTNLTDLVSQPLGFRYFSVDPNNGFFLNGQHYDLHGVDMHQDWLNCGWALTNAQRVTNFTLLKEIGATAVRLSHYEHHDETYQLADQNGIVLWSEVPNIDYITSSAAYYTNTLQQLREMIRQRYNHPSVVCWGLFNEITLDAGPDPSPLISLEAQLVAQEDPTRLTTAAANSSDNAPTTLYSQLICFNKYYGWYGGFTTDLAPWADNFHATYPTRMVGVSEYGCGASISQHSEDPVAEPPNAGPYHPEEYQNLFHESYWQQMKVRPFLWGKYIWNMFDFASDGRNEGDTPGRNDKGLVTYDRQVRKDAFYWYKANWTTNAMVYITGHTFTTRTNNITAKAYSNCDSVELFLNSISQGTRTSTNSIFTWAISLPGGSNTVQAVGTKGDTNVTDSLVWYVVPPPPPPPRIVSVTPSIGCASGGTAITLGGSNFQNGSTITIFGVNATGVMWLNSNTLTAVTGANSPGTYSVVVKTPGKPPTTLTNGFTYAGAPLFAGPASITPVIEGATLSWSSASGVAPFTYGVYEATNSGGEINPLLITNALSAFIPLYPGSNSPITYFFKVNAVDSCGTADTNQVELSARPLLDPTKSQVGDGIPNGWKQQYHLNPFDPALATEDSDGDGMSNLQEYLAGIDPTNSASSFHVISVLPSGINLLVTWMTGSGRTNALQAAVGDASGGYNTNNFTDIFTVTNTSGTVTNYLDVGAATNAPARYYRVRLVP